MENEIALFKKENVALITNTAPVSFNENKASHDKCIEVGNRLIADIKANGSMNDELDKRAAEYLTRARNTVKKMLDKRSPVTKIFDTIRTQFTAMECEVDPSKKDSIPYKLQLARNQYAAKKREEAERIRLEEQRKQQIKLAKDKYKADLEIAYNNALNQIFVKQENELNGIFSGVTLVNYQSSYNKILNYNARISDIPYVAVLKPTNVNPDELIDIDDEISTAKLDEYNSNKVSVIHSLRDNLQELFPSKKIELEKIAKSNDEAEKLRIANEIKAREAAEAQKRADELAKKQEEEKQKAEMAKKQAEMQNLFGESAAQASAYTPKTSVKKKLVPLNAEAFQEIINLWWAREGCNMSVDELSKICKKQLSFCEKLANANDAVLLQSEHIEYQEEVKAK